LFAVAVTECIAAKNRSTDTDDNDDDDDGGGDGGGASHVSVRMNYIRGSRPITYMLGGCFASCERLSPLVHFHH